MKGFTLGKLEDYEEWRTATSGLYDQAGPDLRCYWVIDPCASPDLPGILDAVKPGENRIPLFLNTYREAVAKAGPTLVPYIPGSDFNNWLFNLLETAPAGYLVQVARGEEDGLYEHLQNLAECTGPDGKRAMFRFFDPRIMYAVTTFPYPTAAEQLLGPVLRLDGWEHGRRSAISAGDGEDHRYRCVAPIPYHQEFLDHIWKEVKIHTLIRFYAGSFAVSHPNAAYTDLYDDMETTYRFLEANGFTDVESFNQAAVFTAAYPSCIWENRDVIEAFAALPEKTAFTEAIGAIGEGSHD